MYKASIISFVDNWLVAIKSFASITQLKFQCKISTHDIGVEQLNISYRGICAYQEENIHPKKDPVGGINFSYMWSFHEVIGKVLD